MRYDDLVNRLINGTLAVGDDVWLVDARHEDLGTPHIIPPTKARIDAPANTHNENFLYRAKHYFRPLKKNGDIKVAIIRPYRTIRGRTRFDDSIHIFLTKEEANREYIQQCEALKEQVQQQQDDSNRAFEAQLTDLDARISAAS
jgi:hypothetical protein